ncbi:TonB-dependent receptor domain-containing protein [Glacieibacterium megasporae]|uniref:TonB-dependent receptor domain-containing protein n=1 Tax=Glacieibacterium megasporae TaxID=2835787 RepID=UPI001C1E60BB|nr:TonB-dependent receptor [Polymorphobacter megasporae]UAJ10122.1 TonB-dependent receptor [Polymorphobacter megasporae]
MGLKGLLVSSTAVAALVGWSGSAVAQVSSSTAQTPAQATASTPETPVATPAIGAGNTIPAPAEEIVVTGTSIRGAPPVGSNLISIGQAQIQATPAQSVQQILKSVPAIVGSGSAGQGAFGSADGSGTNAPTIHGLGGSASNSTLILIDGHRFALSGINHALGDPNIVPTVALERVEVLPDGASAVYGSDAVAGVINFITRRNFDGIEASGQVGFADQYKTYNGSFLAGKTWAGGSVLFAYSYSKRDALSAANRSFTAANHIAQGGTNTASFACQPASIQPTGNSTIYGYPYSGAGVSNAQANAFCDFTGLTDLLPQEIRHNGMVKVTQDITDKLTVTGDVVYSNRRDRQNVTRGAVTATIFRTAANAGQVNPFYVGVPGSAATSETVRFNADDLLGPGAHIDSSAEDFYVHGTAEYKLDGNFRITLGGVFGVDNSATQNLGQLCTSCAYLALNGTTNGAGSLTAVSVPATGLIVTQLPLTAANALDVFNPLSTNRTSGAVRASLVDSTQTYLARQTIEDGTLKIDGSLFHLPAGDVKVAVGGELIHYTLRQDITRPLNIGPSSSGSATANLTYARSVQSGYIEALIPIIGPEMGIPGIQSFDVNLSGRYDHYSDFGSTTNPKIAANWGVFDGFKVRANYARSFVAPALTSRGSNAAGITGESGYGVFALGQVNVPVASFAGAAALPGCTAASTTCAIGTSTVPGIILQGGNASLKPQKGKTYSIGADFTPHFVDGLKIGVTYWHNEIRGGITAPLPALAIGASDLSSLLTLYPGGATPAQIAAATAGQPQVSALPQTAYFIYNYQQRNVLNLTVSGIDVDVNYSRQTGIGRFTAGVAFTDELQFDQQIGNGPTFSVLNTTGFNTTFPSVIFQGRANLGWEYSGISADVFVNQTGGYRNYSGTTLNPIIRTNGVPTGGGDHVAAYTTVDLHVAYTIPQKYLHKAQVFVDATNLFDRNPPFYNIAAGYDVFEANPIGRVVTIGVRTAF